MIDKVKFVKDFERMICLAKARAYRNVSLERPLSDSEFVQYKGVMERLGVKV